MRVRASVGQGESKRRPVVARASWHSVEMTSAAPPAKLGARSEAGRAPKEGKGLKELRPAEKKQNGRD